MNSVDARKAVSYAIDRDAIIRGVFQGYALKATSFLSPPFATAGVYQPGLCESCGQQDVAKAKELAAKAGLKPGTTVDLIYNTGGGHEAWVQAVAVQLKDVLGLNVNLRGMPFAELLRVSTQPSRSGLRRAAWSADYPTPDNFLYPLLHTQPADNPGDNRGRYSNPEFDALVDKARATKDQKVAADLYRQAERIAIGQDLADIPLWYRVQFRLFNSEKFQGVNMDFSREPDSGYDQPEAIGGRGRPARLTRWRLEAAL